MEHVNKKERPNGMVRLTPEKGYFLFSEVTKAKYSEAVIKETEVKHFSAVKGN